MPLLPSTHTQPLCQSRQILPAPSSTRGQLSPTCHLGHGSSPEGPSHGPDIQRVLYAARDPPMVRLT